MDTNRSSQLSLRRDEVRVALRELQAEAILLALPALYVGGFILISSTGRLQDPLHGGIPAMILFLLPVVVLALHRLNRVASAWALVLGCMVAVLLLVLWADIGAAIQLFVLPVGLAAIFVSVPGGALAAGACSLFLLYAPVPVSTADRAALISALVGIWGVVGLIWLTRRPLLTAVQWSWTGYEENRRLLEQARDGQVQLKQTLQDLAETNLQLTRLNNLAQALRSTAEEARRAKERFVANVSHELRTPLNMIVGFSEMIMQAPGVYGNDLSPKLLADLDVILRNSRHLSKLIDDVLDLSQIEAGQMALAKECVSLAEVIGDAIIAVRPLFQSKDLYLDAETVGDLPEVLCDDTRIRQVVLNLLSNAGRFTERGGVHIRAWQDGEYVAVSVADTGPGICAESRDDLFEPFHQLDGLIHKRYGGSGLGLSISKSFIELHGGRIWCESEEGRGTTFFFRLPIDPPSYPGSEVSRWFSPYLHYEESARRSTAPVPVVRPRFLVLETGSTLQRLLVRYLDETEIVAIEDLQEAVQEHEHEPADALLVNGLSVDGALRSLGEISALPYGIPVIVCAIPSAGEPNSALGISDYLVKPVARDTLLSALDRLNLQDGTLLVVDDEADAVRLFRRTLLSSGRGYRVLKAEDGQEAIMILREQRPDAMLLDLVMPNMDGFRLLAEKNQDPTLRDIPVVIISARDPAGQPIMSSALAVTQRDGLSVSQVLACISGINATLSATARSVCSESTGKHPD